MPKVAVNYFETCIYKLVHFDDLNDNNIYVGHTTNMTKRKCEHKSRCNNPNSKEHNHKKYQFIRENGGWDKWDMILVEKYPCDNVHEAKKRERYWITQLKASLNVDIPTRTNKEYREDNKEYIKEWFKNYDQKPERKENHNKYREANREKIAEKITCDCGAIHRRDFTARHRKTIKHQDWLKNNNLTIN